MYYVLFGIIGFLISFSFNKPIPDPTDPRVQKTVLGGVKPAVYLIVPKQR